MRYLMHNDLWLPVHGEPAGRKLIGLCHYDVFPEIPEAWREVHRRCLAGATEQSHRDVFVRADGRREHLSWVVAPFRDEAGQVGGLAIYVESVDQQVKTQERLDQHESTIRDLFEQSPVGLNLCRMDGLWVESNSAFLDIIGYSREEADGGLTYWQLTPRKYDADEAIQLEALRTQGRYGPYEKEFIRKDGRIVPVRLNGFLIHRDGETFIWSLIEDLTAQRELEARLEEERAKSIQAAKLAVMGEMAASFAHEINNPLGIIDAYAFALKDMADKPDPALLAEGFDTIREAVERIGKIVHGLRKFARRSAGEPPVDISVTSVVGDAMDLCRARLRTHGVEVEVQAGATEPIRGHAIELSQVLVNLVNNAFDAVQSSDEKWVRVTTCDRPDGSVEIAVEDSGPGVPPRLATEIFQPFVTTKGMGQGTGLGLSISRTIIERHGGSLTLDSTAPYTRFVVSLPR
jgi:PAS domain S-box-containing protein